MNVSLMDDSRIGATSAEFDCGEGQFQFDFPEDFDFGKQSDYKIINGELIYDPIPVEEPTPSVTDLAFANAAISAALSV